MILKLTNLFKISVNRFNLNNLDISCHRTSDLSHKESRVTQLTPRITESSAKMAHFPNCGLS